MRILNKYTWSLNEFEHANRNAAFATHCSSEDGSVVMEIKVPAYLMLH